MPLEQATSSICTPAPRNTAQNKNPQLEIPAIQSKTTYLFPRISWSYIWLGNQWVPQIHAMHQQELLFSQGTRRGPVVTSQAAASRGREHGRFAQCSAVGFWNRVAREKKELQQDFKQQLPQRLKQ